MYVIDDVSAIMRRMDEIDEEMDRLGEKGELDGEKLTEMYYRKLVRGLKMNTGYFHF